MREETRERAGRGARATWQPSIPRDDARQDLAQLGSNGLPPFALPRTLSLGLGCTFTRTNPHAVNPKRGQIVGRVNPVGRERGFTPRPLRVLPLVAPSVARVAPHPLLDPFPSPPPPCLLAPPAVSTVVGAYASRLGFVLTAQVQRRLPGPGEPPSGSPSVARLV